MRKLIDIFSHYSMFPPNLCKKNI